MVPKLFGNKKGLVNLITKGAASAFGGSFFLTLIGMVLFGFFVGFPLIITLLTNKWMVILVVFIFAMVWLRK